MFGSHMSDFAEISQELVACKGGVTVTDEETLLRECYRLLEDPDHLRTARSNAHA